MLGHAMFHAYELSIPVFVAVWLYDFDTTAATLGLIVGVGFAVVGLFAPLGGVLADAFGPKRLVIASVLGMGAGFLAVSLSPTLPAIAAALLLWGLAASLYHPAGLSLLTRGVERRGLALGYHGAAGSAGTAIGPLVVLVSLIFFEWRIVAGLLVVPAVIAVWLGWRLEFVTDTAVEPRPTDRPAAVRTGFGGSLRGFLADSRLLFTGGFVVVFFLHLGWGMYFRGVFTFLPDLLATRPIFDPIPLFGRPVEPGRYVYSGLLMVGVVGQWAGGKLTDRRTQLDRLLLVLLACLVVCTLLFIPASEAGVLPLLAVCAGLGFVLFVSAPITLSLVAEYADSEAHGLSFGFTYFGLFGVGAIGAAAAGVVLTVADPGTLFELLAGVVLVKFGLVAILRYRF